MTVVPAIEQGRDALQAAGLRLLEAYRLSPSVELGTALLHVAAALRHATHLGATHLGARA